MAPPPTPVPRKPIILPEGLPELLSCRRTAELKSKFWATYLKEVNVKIQTKQLEIMYSEDTAAKEFSLLLPTTEKVKLAVFSYEWVVRGSQEGELSLPLTV